MLSLPDDWNYSISGLTAKCKEGKSSIRAAINELMAEGYIIRQMTRTDKGVITGYEYVVYERPRPSCDFPSTENPSSENRTQQNKKEQNKKEQNNHPIVPPEENKSRRTKRKQSEPKKAPDWKPDRFEAFWQAYPCGKSKQAAIKAWDKLRPDDALLEQMARGLKRAMQSRQWQEGIGIPYASTWLNGRRWEDEEDKSVSLTAPAPLAPRRFHTELIDGEEVVVFDD